jgi:hypothetical protein
MRAARKIGPIRRALAQILLGLARFFEWAARLIAPVDAPIDPAYLAVAKRYPGAPEHWLRDIAERMGNFAYAPVQGGTDAWRGGEEAAPESPRARADRIARSGRLMDDWFGAAGPDDRDDPAPEERPSRLPSQVRLRAVPHSIDAREHPSQSAADRAPPVRDAPSPNADAPKPRLLRPRIASSSQAARQDRPATRQEDAARPAAANTREPSRNAPTPRADGPRTSLRPRPSVSVEELPVALDERLARPQADANMPARDEGPAEQHHQAVAPHDWYRSAVAHTIAQVKWRSRSGQEPERREAYDPRYRPRQTPPDLTRPSAPPAKSVDPKRWSPEHRASDPKHIPADKTGTVATHPEVFEWPLPPIGSAETDAARLKAVFAAPPKSPWPSAGKPGKQAPVESRWPDLPQSAPPLADLEETQLPSVTARLESLRAEQERGAWSA